VSAREQWLLDRMHSLVHRHARGPAGCVFVPLPGRPPAVLDCSAAGVLDLPSLLISLRPTDSSARERYPGAVEVMNGSTKLTATVLPVVVAGELVGDLVVLGLRSSLDATVQRHLALIGAAGSASMLVDAQPSLPSGDEYALSAGERIALYEVLIAATDLRDLVERLGAWLRARVVVQSASLELLEVSDDGATAIALGAHHVTGDLPECTPR